MSRPSPLKSKCGPDQAALSDIDSLAERAYSLRFVDLGEALALAGSALRKAEQLQYPRGIGRALVAVAAARCRMMDLDAASEDLALAFEVFRTAPDPVGHARALSWQGSIELRRAGYARSMGLWTEALSHFQAAGDRAGEGDVLHKIGTLLTYVGDFAAGIEALGESRRIKEELDDQHGLALCVSDVGLALYEMGEHESARASFEQALAYYRKTGAGSAVLANLVNLGLVCSELGDFASAVGSLEESIATSRRTGEHWAESRAVYNLAELYCTMGDPQAALDTFAEAEALASAIGDRVTEIGIDLGAGRALLRLGQVAPGIARLTSALAAAEAGGLQRFIAEAHEALALAHEAASDFEAAVRHMHAAHDVRERVRRAGAALHAQYRAQLEEMRRVQQETELQVLKAQLQPHLLFNALNSLLPLIERSPAEAARMVTQIGDLLRLALEQSSAPCTTLVSELEFVSAYVRLEQARHRGAFSLTIHSEPGLGHLEVPHLLLQPLAENAIRHGFRQYDGHAHLQIMAELAAGDRLLLSVRDTGVGIGPDWTLPPLAAGATERSGFGLRNTRLRLQRLYGADHAFRLGPNPGGGTRVEIEIPLNR